MRFKNFIPKWPFVNFFLNYPARDIILRPVQSARILKSANALRNLVADIADVSDKVILFGSRGKGVNREDSDYDLFIVTNDPATTAAIVKKYSTSSPIPIDSTIYTPAMEASIQERERPFLIKLKQGVVLWDNPPHTLKPRSHCHDHRL